MKNIKINNWETWKELCEQNDIDPYEYVDFGIDMGGGDSLNYEYIGDTPEKKKKHPLLRHYKEEPSAMEKIADDIDAEQEEEKREEKKRVA